MRIEVGNLLTGDDEVLTLEAGSGVGLVVSGEPGMSNPHVRIDATGGGGSLDLGLNVKGEVATSADLPSSAENPGDAYIAEDTNDVWAWTGSDWTDVGHLLTAAECDELYVNVGESPLPPSSRSSSRGRSAARSRKGTGSSSSSDARARATNSWEACALPTCA